MARPRRPAGEAGGGSPRAGRGINRVRIVGGELRGRGIEFPDAPGLRPSPDRVRETLFNWLQANVAGARCLDLFAGSGALGIEAASRGARGVVLVEQSHAVAGALHAAVARLGLSSRVRVVEADALAWLASGRPAPFDIVFLDPPFASALLAPAIDTLEKGGWLADDALIYLERDGGVGDWPLPATWRLLRDKRAGQVAYALARREPRDRGMDEA
jgi:16S rRNA (guanine966-N2)-methyltransferase